MAKRNYFELELSKDLRQLASTNPNLYYHRLLDTATMRYALSNPNVFNIRQPCDLFVLHEGHSFFLELKSSRSKSSYSFSYIPDHQIQSLRAIERSDTKDQRTIYGYFLLNKRHPGSKLEMYAVRADTINGLINSGLKSIKWSKLKDIAIEIPRVKGTWDLLPFFNSHYRDGLSHKLTRQSGYKP